MIPMPSRADIAGNILGALAVGNAPGAHTEAELDSVGLSSLFELQGILSRACDHNPLTRPIALADLESVLTTGKCLFAAMGSMDADSRGRVESALVKFDSYALPTFTDGGMRLAAVKGERVQLRFHAPEGPTPLWAHYLMQKESPLSGEIHVALRWLHGDDDEEVAIRFRSGSIVAGQAVEFPIQLSAQPVLISAARHDGLDIVLANGIPLFHRAARGTDPTGVTLDVIGGSEAATCINLGCALVTQRQPAFLPAPKALDTWFDSVLSHCSDGEHPGAVSQWLLASDRGVGISEATGRAIISKNIASPLGYRDFDTAAVLQRMPEGAAGAIRHQLAHHEPSPIVDISHIDVDVYAKNASGVILRRMLRHEKQLSLLQDISMKAFSGDIVGIIGRNGAGKSTLLKAMVGAMPISRGGIGIDGWPILLRPGAGMIGELTGRENIIKTGLLLGHLPDEIQEMMDDIVDFSGLNDHIDKPFKYYSDGMRSRLIFSLATAIPRDILLLDELLSAGDMGFQEKAIERLEQFILKSKVVFVVQHTFDFIIRRCTKCLYLENGHSVYYGDPNVAIEMYRENL